MGKPISGGIIALRGFDYQATVILDRLFAHFDEHGPDATVRPEGADDLDLTWVAADGSFCQRFEQIKKPREDSEFQATLEAWSLADVVRDLVPGALRHLDGNAHEQVWVLGDEVEADVSSLIEAGRSAPRRVSDTYWRAIHMLARNEIMKAFSGDVQVRKQLMRWSHPGGLSSKPDSALAQLVAAFRQRVIELGESEEIADAHVAATRRFHAHLPDTLARIHIQPLFGSEQEIALRICERLERQYGLKPSVVEATLFRNLRGFINDIAKQPGRYFDKEEFEWELRSVWPTMMPVRELPSLDDGHVPRADLSGRFTTGWSGRALEVIGVSGSGKTMLAAEVGQRSHIVSPERLVVYVEIRPDAALRDVLTGVAFHLRRLGLSQPFPIAIDGELANDSALSKLARVMSALPQDLLLLLDLVQGTCSEAFARDLAIFIRQLSSEACRVGVLGQESAFRHLNRLDREQLGIGRMDVRGFNFDEFASLVSQRHSRPDYALLDSVFRRVTAGRSAGLYAKLARSLADAPSLQAMRDLALRPADEILGYAEQQRFARISNSARPAAEKLVCFALPFDRSEAEEAFPDANVGAAIRELLSLGLLRATEDDSYEMHETVRAGLEGTISSNKRQEAHKALASYYARRGDVTAEVFHLERAGLVAEARNCAREAFLRGERWSGLAGFVAAHKLVTAREVLGVIAAPFKIEGTYMLADILSQLNEPDDAQEIFAVLREQPQRFLADYQWASGLIDAYLSSDSSQLDELIRFCLGIACEPDRRDAGLSSILTAARRHSTIIGPEMLAFFDDSAPDVKRVLIPFLLTGGHREAFRRAFNFMTSEEDKEPSRQGGRPKYNLILRNQDEVAEFLAALPPVPDHVMLMSRSPCFGPLTHLVWRNRHLLKTPCIDLLQAEDVEPSIQQAAVRVLALLGEPCLFALCEALARVKENPIRGFAALAPALVPTLVSRDRYKAILLNPEQDIQVRMAALSVLGLVGADIGALYEQVRTVEYDPGRSELLDLLFLQNAVQSPFTAAIPLLEKQLCSFETTKSSIFAATVTSLGRLPDHAATAMLLKLLSHPEKSIRMAAILSLGNKRTKTALSQLKNCFHDEHDHEFSVQLATAIIASVAESVADLGAAPHDSEALSLWRCVLTARTRDVAYAQQLVAFATDVNSNWQLRRSAINAAGFLPFEAALDKMLPILRERSSLLIDNHQSLYAHNMLTLLLLAESKNLLYQFTSSSIRFIALVGGIFDDAKKDLVDDRGLPTGAEAANWLYERLRMHGWPKNSSAPDTVINELHIPLLQSAILRALRRAGHSELIKTELARAEHIWFATKCLIELSHVEMPSTGLVEQLKGLTACSPIAGDPRLEPVIANLPKAAAKETLTTNETSKDIPGPQWAPLSYEEALMMLSGNGPALDLKSQIPIVFAALTVDQFGHLVRLSDPANDRDNAVTEHYLPGITFGREGYSVARRQRTYSSASEPAGAWIRPALIAANRFELTVPWHEEILSAASSNAYAERLIACLSAKDDAEAFYRTLYHDPQLLLPHICTYTARQRIAKFIDDRMIPFLASYASSGTDEIFEGLCGVARLLDSPAVVPMLSALFRRWAAYFEDWQTVGRQRVSHHVWRAFRDLTEHPQFEHIEARHGLLSRVLHTPLPWYDKQQVTRVFERDSGSYIQLESLLFRSEDWEHFYEDEIERLQEAAERLFKQIETE